MLAMGGQKITRYVDLGRFLAMLGERDESPKGRLFFASPDRLSDPQEGILGSADRKLALNEAKNLYGGVDRRAFACWLPREWQNSLLMVGISCWYLGDTESHAMWQIFGTGGVAIESTVEKVKNCLAPAAKIQTRLVEYVDRATRPATGLDPVRVLSFKRPPYQHENELRFFVSFSDEERELIKNLRGLGQDGEVFVHDRTQGQLGPNGMSVPFDVMGAIDRVVLGPTTPILSPSARPSLRLSPPSAPELRSRSPGGLLGTRPRPLAQLRPYGSGRGLGSGTRPPGRSE